MIQCDLHILIEPHFTEYSGKLHQPTMITGNDITDDVTMADDVIGHVTHINKHSGIL